MHVQQRKIRLIRDMALVAIVLCTVLVVLSSAHAQTLGGTCITTGQIAIAGVNPGYILTCNGSNWIVGQSINSSGSVGIGTTAPQGLFEVSKGSAYFNNGNIDGTYGDQIIFGSAPSGYPSTYLHKIRTSTSASGPGSSGIIFTLSDGTSSGHKDVMSLTETGNVGIGVNSPNNLLSLGIGAVSSLPGIEFFAGNSTTAGPFSSGQIASGFTSTTYASGFLDLQYPTNSNTFTTGLRLTNGNIGIGTTIPGTSLDLSKKTDALALPSGTTAQRPSTAINGEIRYNTDSTPTLEAYVNNAWASIGGAGASTINLGTSASVTNPQRTSDATTGLYSSAVSTVAVSAAGKEVEQWNTLASAVDYLSVTPGLSGTAPKIAVAGSTSPQNLNLAPNGATGVLQFGGSTMFWQNTTDKNVIVGASAFPTTYTGGSGNAQLDTALGYQAMNSITVGNSSTAVGALALTSDVSGSNNSAFGNGALQYVTGNNNTGVGTSAAGGVQAGGNNTAVGASALSGAFSAPSSNTAIGAFALSAVTTGSSNTALGSGVGSSTLSTGTNNILIGTSGAVTTPGAATNYNLNIGNLLQGDMTNVSGTAGTGNLATLYLQSVASGVDYLQIAGSATTAHNVVVSAQGTDTNANIELLPKGTGGIGISNAAPGALLDVGKAGTTLGTMRLEGSTSGYVQLQTNVAAGSWTMTLPVSAGTNGYVLQTDGTGITSWVAAGGTVTLGTSASVTNPQRASDATTGLFSPATNTVAVSAGGIEAMQWNTVASGNTYVTITPGASAAPTIGTSGSFSGAGLNIDSGSGPLTLVSSGTTSGSGVSITASSGGSGGSINITGGAGTSGAGFAHGGNVVVTAGVSGGGTSTPGVIELMSNVGIGTTSPHALLDLGASGSLLGVLRFEGNTSGYVQLQSAAAAGSWTMTLPTTPGTNGYVLQTNGAGVTSWVANGTGGGGGGSSNLGISATAASPQVTGDATTGFYTAGTGLVDVSSSGNGVVEWSPTGENLIGTAFILGTTSIIPTGAYQINYENVVFIPYDDTDFSIGLGQGALMNNYHTAPRFSPNDTGEYNTGVGVEALYTNITGSYNTAVGAAALQNADSAYYNTALGYFALNTDTTGAENTAVGSSALTTNSTGNDNTAVGINALIANDTGSYNIAVGAYALDYNIAGNDNVAIGNTALGFNTSGSSNTVVGGGAAGGDISTGSNNTILGNAVGSNTLLTGSNNILIGTTPWVDTVATNTNYNLNIGNLLQGDMTYTYNTSPGTEALYLQSTSGSVDYIQIAGAATSSPTTVISAQGTDSIVNISLTPKGGGIATVSTTSALALPSGTTAQRPSTAINGEIRYNTDSTPTLEAYVNNVWTSIGGGGSGSVNLGTSASVTNPQRSSDATTGLYSSATGTVAVSAGGKEVEQWNTLTSAVDYLSITPGLSGAPVQMAVAGSTTNQNLAIMPKGTGGVGIGTTVPAATLDVNGSMYSRRFALTDGATIAVNWANGNTQSVTLGGNRTFTFTGGADGGKYILIIKQDTTGSRTATWPGSVRWPGGTAPTLTTTVSKTDYIVFIYNGVSSTYDGVSIAQNF